MISNDPRNGGQPTPGGSTPSSSSLPNGGQQPAAWQKYADWMYNNTKNVANNVGTQGQQKAPAQPAPQSATPQQAPQTPLPGKNGYTPTTAPYGMDQTNPGVKEQHWNQNQNLWMNGAFAGPGQGQQFWNQIQGNYNKASQDLTPQFDKYYDRARDQAAGAANQQANARGAYGSSAALNNVGNVIGGVEADRAKASTDFMFQNESNKSRALDQYGNLAFGAEALGNQQRGLDLQALAGQSNEAGQAQDARDRRIQGMFDNGFRAQEDATGFLNNRYGNMLSSDQDLYTGATNAGPAATADALAASQNRRQQNSQDLSNGLSLYGAFKPSAPAAATGTMGSSAGNPGGSFAPSKGYYNY
jgi:hypothetical protein